MTLNYDDIATDRRARLSPESLAQREVFEKAYDIALQVIALREGHSLTQAQLAERCGMRGRGRSRPWPNVIRRR